MAKKVKESARSSRHDYEYADQTDEEELGFFESLFAPGTIDTDVSGDEYGSMDSGTIYTQFTSEGSDEFTEESSTGSVMIRFDRDLRAKHRTACKNMTVGILLLQLLRMFNFI